MKVLGIDPGLARTGWAVLEDSRADGGASLVAHGLIPTPSGSPLPERLRTLEADLSRILELHAPEEVAVEAVFFAKPSPSVAATQHARGVILLAACKSGCRVHEYNPREVKSSLTGFGAAQKGQMQKFVARLLGLASVPRPDDVADAMAIALCHLRSARLSERIRQGRVRVLQGEV